MKDGPCPTMSGGATLLSHPRDASLDAMLFSSANSFLVNLHRIESNAPEPAVLYYNGAILGDKATGRAHTPRATAGKARP